MHTDKELIARAMRAERPDIGFIAAGRARPELRRAPGYGKAVARLAQKRMLTPEEVTHLLMTFGWVPE